MKPDLAILLKRFSDALQNHFSLVTSNPENVSEKQISQAYQAVQEAFIRYDNALYEQTEYDLPFDIYDLEIEEETSDQSASSNKTTDLSDCAEEDLNRGLADIGLAAYAVNAVGEDADVPDGEGQVVLQHIDLSELGLTAQLQAELEDKLGSYLQDEDNMFNTVFDYQMNDDDYDFDDEDDDELDENEEAEYDDDFLDDEENEYEANEVFDDEEIALDYDLLISEENE